MASSSRAWRIAVGSNGRPMASYSGRFQPAPMATSSRPSERTSRLARSWASDRRMAQVVVEDEGADPKGRRGRRDRGHRRDRRQLLDQVVGDDQRVEAHALGAPSEVGELAPGHGIARVGEELERSHAADRGTTLDALRGVVGAVPAVESPTRVATRPPGG